MSNSHLALSSALAQEGLGCLWLRGPCCLVGGLRRLKPTPNLFSFREKADLAGKVLVCTGPSNPPFASWGETQLVLILDTGKSALREAAFGKPKLCSGTNLSPNASVLRKATLA